MHVPLRGDELVGGLVDVGLAVERLVLAPVAAHFVVDVDALVAEQVDEAAVGSEEAYGVVAGEGGDVGIAAVVEADGHVGDVAQGRVVGVAHGECGSGGNQCVVGEHVFAEGEAARAVALHAQGIAGEVDVLGCAVEYLKGSVVALAFDVFGEHEVGGGEGALVVGVDVEHDMVTAVHAVPVGGEGVGRDVGGRVGHGGVHLGVAVGYDVAAGVAGLDGERLLVGGGDCRVECDVERAALAVVPACGFGHLVGRALLLFDGDVGAEAHGTYGDVAHFAVVAYHEIFEALIAGVGVDVLACWLLLFFKNHHVGEEPAVGHGPFFLLGEETELRAVGHIGECHLEGSLVAVGHVGRCVAVDLLHRGGVAFHLHAHRDEVVLVGPRLGTKTNHHG